MAKPVKTNIAPPPAPPVTTWTDTNIVESVNYALEGSTAFDQFVGSLFFDWFGGELDAHAYDYIFMAANGKDDVDLTVNSGNLQNGIIVTGNGKDLITGNDSGELIFSGNGMDIVNAGGGADIVLGGNGVDTLAGEAGDDLLLGENGDDRLSGGDGDDELQGGLDNDLEDGGADNDVLFGDEGNDTLNGGSDNGTASVTVEPGNGPAVLHLKDKEHSGLLTSIPVGPVDAEDTPNDAEIAKVGIYTPVDSDGAPTDTFANGDPKLYFVYSITVETTGTYTVFYTQGNAVDGAGDPSPDRQVLNLTAGQTYYFSLSYDSTNDPSVQIEIYAGDVTAAAVAGGLPNPLDTLSAGVPNFHDYFEAVAPEAQTIVEFVGGDDLFGGIGSDAFVYDLNQTNNVDVIWDYNQGSGALDALEGDTVHLVNVTQAQLDAAIAGAFLADVDDDGDVDDLVILFSDNHAIGFVGITDASDITFVLDTP
jgi:Ca2+-binding RTX toxin-like protein